jgi:hypothetical protein
MPAANAPKAAATCQVTTDNFLKAHRPAGPQMTLSGPRDGEANTSRAPPGSNPFQKINL